MRPIWPPGRPAARRHASRRLTLRGYVFELLAFPRGLPSYGRAEPEDVRVRRLDCVARLQASLFENRPDDFIRSTRVGGRFEDDQAGLGAWHVRVIRQP